MFFSWKERTAGIWYFSVCLFIYFLSYTLLQNVVSLLCAYLLKRNSELSYLLGIVTSVWPKKKGRSNMYIDAKQEGPLNKIC